MRRTFAALLAAAISLGGCAGPSPLGSIAAGPAARPDWAAYYAYSRGMLEDKQISRQPKSGYSLERWELLSPEPGTRPIHLDWYRTARPGRRPLVILSPILAGDDLYIREFAAFYAARGMQAVIVYRQKEVFSADRPLKDVEEHFRKTVIELRQALDWLETQEGVDPEKIGSFAISLGAILTVILAAVEPRIRCSVFGLPAGHVAEIIMTSQDKAIRKRRRAYLEKRGWDKARGLAELKAVIRSEPMLLAPQVDPKRALMIIGLFDRVLGLGRSLDLWRAMGRPKLIVLPTGHYTAYFATPYLKIATYSFFREKLGESSSSTSSRKCFPVAAGCRPEAIAIHSSGNA